MIQAPGFINEFDETSGIAEQPSKIIIPMKPHQLTILKNAIKLEQNKEVKIPIDDSGFFKFKFKSKIGILCDKVGAGKSLQILSIIANSKYCYGNINTSQTINNVLSFSIQYPEIEIDSIIPTNIIVVPHTIIKQWQKYITEYTSLTYYTINTKKTFDTFNENNIKKNQVDTYDIILVSSTRYKEFGYNWNWRIKNPISRLIFDEADYIKISRINFINSTFNWFLTSSYLSLQYPNGNSAWQNSHGVYGYHSIPLGFIHRQWVNGISNTGDIKNTFEKLKTVNIKYLKYIFNTIFLKNSDTYIEQSFNLELPEIIRVICKNPMVLNILDKIVNTETINMINAGDIQGAMKNMNCYKVEHKNLIETVTKDLNIDLKNKKIEFEMKSKMTFSSKYAKEQSLSNISKAIAHIESKINTLVTRIKDHNMCSICFDNIDNKTILNCCHSAYCFECVSMWLSNSKICPHCRHNITPNNMILVSDEFDTSGSKPIETKLKYKIDNLKEIIKKRKLELGEKFKFLVFTEYDNMFGPLEEFLETKKISYSRIKGSCSTVNKHLREFKTFKTPEEELNGTFKETIKDCLLLNSNFCGNGLNLEVATDVFIYHSMSKEMTEQIIGRAQRPGRVGQLKVWKLCHENEPS